MDIYRFSVGQTVRLMQGAIHRGKSISCEVMQIMPFDGSCYQYRVRGVGEQFDRVAKEFELAELPASEAAAPSPAETGFKSISISRKGNR
jgi:hypothetical protein